MTQSFGERLRSARERRDMSAEYLSRVAELDATEISHYERGRRAPGAENIRKLAVALDITADYLLGLTDETRRISDGGSHGRS